MLRSHLNSTVSPTAGFPMPEGYKTLIATAVPGVGVQLASIGELGSLANNGDHTGHYRLLLAWLNKLVIYCGRP